MNRLVKVGAFILRKSQSGRCSLLLFTHPDYQGAPIQIPGGSVEENEDIIEALHREIHEETGLVGLMIKRKIGVSEIPSMLNRDELLERHCFLLHAPENVKETWIHVVEGSGIDGGMRFAFAWHFIDPIFSLSGDLGAFLSPAHIPELYEKRTEKECL